MIEYDFYLFTCWRSTQGFIWRKVVLFKHFDNNLTMSFYLCGDSSSIPSLQGSKSEITKGDGRNSISINGR